MIDTALSPKQIAAQAVRAIDAELMACKTGDPVVTGPIKARLLAAANTAQDHGCWPVGYSPSKVGRTCYQWVCGGMNDGTTYADQELARGGAWKDYRSSRRIG